MSAGHKDTRRDATCQSGTVFFSNPLMSDVESDWSPVHDAAFNGRALTLQKLIDQGACVNLNTLDKVSPLHGACTRGHTTCAKLLLENGANVNSSTVDGKTALTEACAGGHVTCISLLLHHGAASLGTSQSDSPIHMAATKGHPDCIEPLVQYGADVDQHIDKLGSPLQIACTNHHLSTVRKLLQVASNSGLSRHLKHDGSASVSFDMLGANVNRTVSGDSPLHIAARLSNPELVSVLLDHGADRFFRNSEGKQPLDLAPPNSLTERLLRQAGGVSPLMQLCRLHIRKTMGKQRLGAICDLDLPAQLTQYLLYQSDPRGDLNPLKFCNPATSDFEP